VSFDVPDISITPGEPYYITLSPPGGSEYAWCVGWNNPYQKGGSSNTPHDWCFRTYVEESENNRPVINITYPDDGDTVMDNITISGEAHDADGDYTIDWVMVKIDDGSWFFADGTVSWSYIWDTTLVGDGFHTISAIASDGSLQSFIDSVSVFVDNEEGPVGNPDLIITDIWNEDDFIFYQIRNIGNDSASGGYNVVLSVDDVFMESVLVDEFLDSGERFTSSFMYSWDCSGLNDSVVVFVDYDDVVIESDESNNVREEFWNCDTSDPEITFGPVVTDISQDSATIRWRTNEECDSKVFFDSIAYEYNEMISVDEYVLEHSIKLNDLDAGATYHYMVESCDKCGNMFCSRDYYFETLPQADNRDPSVSLFVPDNLTGNSIIRAEVTDDNNVDMVLFKMDDDQLLIDYAPPWECVVDASEHDDGEHEFVAGAYDESGNSGADSMMGNIVLYDGCRLFNIIIEPPDNIFNQVSYVWDIDFKIIVPSTSFRVVHWSISIDGIQVDDGPILPNEFIDGIFTREIRLRYSWDLTNVPNGEHVITVKATDEMGSICEKNMTVEKIDIPEELDIEVKRYVYIRSNNVWVAFRITNNDDVPISNVKLYDEAYGFQPTDFFHFVDYSLDISSKKTFITVESDDIDPDEYSDCQYQLMPVFYAPLISDYSIGTHGNIRGHINTPLITISYDDPTGTTHEYDVPCPLTNGKTTIGIEDFNIDDSNYLIITNPERLQNRCSMTDDELENLLLKLAELASERYGYLGYLPDSSTYRSSSGIMSLIEENGLWTDLWNINPNPYHFLPEYILFVGETEIIPSWTIHGWNLMSRAEDGHLVHVEDIEYSDQVYADPFCDTFYPFYCIGRIIGDDYNTILNSIENSINFNYDGDNAYLVSGTDDVSASLQDDFNNAIDDISDVLEDKIAFFRLRLSNYPSSWEQRQKFEEYLPSRDLIIFGGHGLPDEWWPFLDSVPRLNRNPIVFAIACLTGDYESSSNSIAEDWFNAGAAVYIGSTENSPGNVNPEAGEEFAEQWYKNRYIGDVFTRTKRILFSPRNSLNDWENYWCYEFNLYGDPKFGGPFTYENFNDNKDQIIITPPPSSIEIKIPEYEIKTYDTIDNVNIPGGMILLEEEFRPKVPYYRYSIDFSNEYHIQNIELIERSDLTRTTGLNLPITRFSPFGNITMEMKGDWYPNLERIFSWELIRNKNNQTLIIDIYPFYYNPDTTNVEFYQNYEFDIEFIQSDISINSLLRSEEVNKPGDEIIIDMQLNNTGEKQDVTISGVIRKFGLGEIEQCLPLRTLKDFSGICTNTIIIDTKEFETDAYSIELNIYDTYGNIVAKKTESFYLETPLITLQSLSGGFGISATVKNTDMENVTDIHWSITLDGNMVFFGGYKEGNIPMVEPDETYEIKSGLMLGVGPAEITVNVAGVKKTISCFLLGPFVMNIKEI
jgi:hypothetical protein